MSEDLFEQVSLPPPVEGPRDELVDRERAALLGSIDAYHAQAAIPNPEDQSPRTHRRRLRRISYVVLAAALIAAIAIVLPGHRTPLVRFTTRWELAKPLRMH